MSMPELRGGKIYIGDYECRPRSDVPGVIADFFFKFQTLSWEEKEAVLSSADYDEVLNPSPFSEPGPMTTQEYKLHLDRKFLIAILDNESTLLRLRDIEAALSKVPDL